MISVIVPVYNRIEALKKALDSITCQTFSDIEVIVVDDGSINNFQFSIFNFQEKMNVRFIRQNHSGAPAARNRGLAEVQGEYVIFWDADVIGRGDMLEKMLNTLKKNPSASYCYSNFQFSIFNFQTIFKFLNFKKKMTARPFDTEILKQSNYIHTTSLIRRSDAIEWDESIRRFQDWDLWLTMAEQGKKGVWVDEYLFSVLAGGTMSRWLPRLAYKAPFRWLPGLHGMVKDYNEAKKTIFIKHSLFVHPS